jgi:hypothetical protein
MLPLVKKLGLKIFISLNPLAKRMTIYNYPSKSNFLPTCSLFSICLVMSYVISIFNISISFAFCVYSLMVSTMDRDLPNRPFYYL